MQKKGFTIVELMIVVIIIAVLVTLALPQYKRVLERGKRAEAFQTLGTMYKAWRAYYDIHEHNPSADGSDVDVELPKYYGDSYKNYPNTKYWWYGFGDLANQTPEEVEVVFAQRIHDDFDKEYYIGLTEQGLTTYGGNYEFE